MERVRHRGALRAEAATGGGPAGMTPDGVTVSPHLPWSGARLTSRAMELEPRVILVVDDEESARDALAEVLASPGRKILASRDGDEALAVAKRVRPCLILLDWVMPGADGASFLRAREASPELRDVPVFLTSATHEGASDARIQAVLPKGADIERLRAAIGAACGRHCPRFAACPFAEQG